MFLAIECINWIIELYSRIDRYSIMILVNKIIVMYLLYSMLILWNCQCVYVAAIDSHYEHAKNIRMNCAILVQRCVIMSMPKIFGWTVQYLFKDVSLWACQEYSDELCNTCSKMCHYEHAKNIRMNCAILVHTCGGTPWETQKGSVFGVKPYILAAVRGPGGGLLVIPADKAFLLLVLLFKKVGNARPGETDWHPICSKTTAPQYQLI